MKVFFLLLTLLGTAVWVTAQDVSDALLFSEMHPSITARAMGVGNALGALGGDLSTVSRNPAGLAVYRRAEFSFSMGGFRQTTNTDFFKVFLRNRRSRIAFGNLGLIIPKKNLDNRNWKMVNFGITFNRIADFDGEFGFSGITTGSRVQAIAEHAKGMADPNADPYEVGAAYEAFLINPLGNNEYIGNGGTADPNALVEKSQSVSRRGGVNELGLSLGGNYKNKLYLAASLGINFLTYQDDRIYRESTPDLNFISMDLEEEKKVEGTGINLKLGMIYRINEIFRVGAAVHTPTAYRLVDNYNTGLNAAIIYNDTLRESFFAMEDQEPNVLQHNLSTPWVFMLNGGAVIGERGFIGLDLEYLDYGTASFSLLEDERTLTNNQFINKLNNDIEDNYTGVFRVKIGGEITFGITRLRLGYQFQSSPFEVSVEGLSDFRHDISAGVGFRWKHFYVDAAYQHTLREFGYSPYTTSVNFQRITGAVTNSQVMLTLGVVMFRD